LGEHDGERRHWYLCACCPPNLMRTIATFPHLLATMSDGAVQVQQYAAAEIGASVAGKPVKLAVETDYPWSGEVTVRVLESGDAPWSLQLREPAWAGRVGATIDAGGTEQGATLAAIAEPRVWRAGDVVRLSMEMPIRVVEPDPRIDAVRDSVAIERGPLVYAIEAADLPEPWHVEDISVEEPITAEAAARDDVEPGLVGVRVNAVAEAVPAASWPYAPDPEGSPVATAAPAATEVTVEAIPYFAWANRTPGAMRVWIPRAR
jgi:DUF1680 family protein